MMDGVYDAALIGLLALPVVFALTLHELAHGYAALALGDDTARRMGRLSINPLRHVDRIGTVLVPAVLIAVQWLTIRRVVFLFGWAKPVPVMAWRFRDPRRGMALVAAAGPVANFGLAWLGALGLHAVDWVGAGVAPVLEDGLDTFIIANLVLGLFNLLPIPPLDGGRMVVGVLPARLAVRWARLERFGIAAVLLLLASPWLLESVGVRFSPVGAAIEVVLPRAFQLVCRLAFLDV